MLSPIINIDTYSYYTVKTKKGKSILQAYLLIYNMMSYNLEPNMDAK